MSDLSVQAGGWSLPLVTLLELGRKARHAESTHELQFLAVNETYALAPYRQAALWLREGGVAALSGVVQLEANVPYVLWLNEILSGLSGQDAAPQTLTAGDIPGEAARQWGDWLPAHGLWLPVTETDRSGAVQVIGGLLLARDEAWDAQQVAVLAEWLDLWGAEWRHRHQQQPWRWPRLQARLREHLTVQEGQRWWQTRLARWGVGIVLLLCLPVHLTVLAPGELVPARPVVIRAPLEGVIDTFHVQPNQKVAKGQVLFGFDETLIQSKLEVSRQALATSEAEYRQAAQLALSEVKSKVQLAQLAGKIEERRAETAFLAGQLDRARVLAPQAGLVLFDDPSEWAGKPVAVGERIMRIAAPGDVEVEAWVPLADAIPLPEQASVSLYLNASPLSPVEAELRYFAFNAVERADGNFAYRLRARVSGATDHRVGLKGTARIQGQWVPLIYWVLRRPLASIRTFIGR